MRSFVLRSAALATVVAATACSSAGSAPTESTESDLNEGQATIVFAADGSMTAPAKLVEGQLLTVKYALGRHSPCDGRPNEVGLSADGGRASTFIFDDQGEFCPSCFYAAHIVVPSGHQLALWANTQAWEGASNTCWDSNGGRNFVFPIAPSARPIPTITFEADQSVHQAGALVAGARAQIRYSTKRTGCPVTPSMMADGRSVPPAADGSNFQMDSIQVSTGSGPAEPFELLTFTVPKGHHVSFWFKSNGGGFEPPRACSSSWDSNGGQNFNFAIANPI